MTNREPEGNEAPPKPEPTPPGMQIELWVVICVTFSL